VFQKVFVLPRRLYFSQYNKLWKGQPPWDKYFLFESHQKLCGLVCFKHPLIPTYWIYLNWLYLQLLNLTENYLLENTYRIYFISSTWTHYSKLFKQISQPGQVLLKMCAPQVVIFHNVLTKIPWLCVLNKTTNRINTVVTGRFPARRLV